MPGVRLGAVLAVALLTHGASALDYVIFGPKTVRSNQTLPVSIFCGNASSDIIINVTLSHGRDNFMTDDEDGNVRSSSPKSLSKQITKSFTIKPNHLNRLELNVGDLRDENVNLKITGSDSKDFFSRSVSDMKLEREESETKTQLAFVQTDQPLYKAKDTVRFRVVTVNKQLLPIHLPLTVRILDPANNIVKQYANVSDPKVVGYFAGDFLLSAEPLLGAWKAEVRTSNSDTIIGSKEFSVREYVLPRFDVKIVSTPAYVTPSDSELVFFVESNYTFGEPVKGKLDVTAIAPPISKWNDDFGSSISRQPSLNQTVSISDFNGRSSIKILTAFILDANRTYDVNNNDKVEIRATFTESLTGQQRNATNVFVPISSKPYKLEFLSNDETFLPGFPFKLRARVTDLNGRPLPPSTKQIKIEVSLYDKRGSWGKRIFFDKNLNKTVTIDNTSDDEGRPSRFRRPRPDQPSSIPVPAEVISFAIPADGVITVDIPTPKEARRIELNVTYQDDEKSLTVKGKESPSSSFLDIKPLSDGLQAGRTASFGINMTTRTDEVVQFLIQSNSNSSFLWSNSSSESGSYIVVSVPVSESMGSTGRLLVYYVRADKEIVGNINVLSPQPASKNNVTVSAEAKSGLGYAQPGEEASFKVNTSPASFVAFLAMDESLLLMKTGNDLSADEINAAVGKDKFTLSDMYSAQDYFEKSYESGQFILTNNKLPTSEEEGFWYNSPWEFNGLFDSDDAMPVMAMAMGPVGASAAGLSTSYRAGESNLEAAESAFEQTTVLSSSEELTSLASTSEESAVENLQAPSQTRKDFRQSFLFETTFSDSDGFAELRSKVPDAITTWRIKAFSLSNTSGLGLTITPAKLRVFQPFFAVLNLPFSIVRFENLTAEVMVFNYMSQQQDVNVKLEIRNPDNTTAVLSKKVTAKQSEGVTAAFTIIPKHIGDMVLKVTAQSPFAADQLEKTLPVKPEGVKQYFSKPVFIDLRQSAKFDLSVSLPSDLSGKVTGSDRVEVRVVGDILGAAMNNLDKLIRLPTGCGEQNMATTTPNLVVAKYLKRINRLNDPQKSKLIANIQLGYQRELSYRHDDNSYSAWGKSDPIGSTWLTAYVARVFVEAAEFAPTIDDDVIKTALRFLIDQQKNDGSFEENGKVIDKQHQGGASSGIGLTAFCLLSFLEYKDSGKASVPKFDESMQQATSFLESKFSILSNDSYSLAITAYALARAKSAESAAVLDLLEQKMIKNTSVAYWTTVASLSDQGADSEHSYPTNAKDVEATAYALLAYMASDKPTSALPIVSWLISKQNAEGGFVSTQDTVVGLTGLAEFAKVFINPPSLKLDVNHDKKKQSLSVTPETSVVLQTVEIPSKPKNIVLHAQGKGVALAYVSWTYHVSKPAEDIAFDLNVTTTSAKADMRIIIIIIIIPYKVGNLSQYSKVTLKINGSDSTDFFDRTVDGLAVGNDQTAPAKKQLAFIQTDQPLYKAKDTVRFRVVTVDEQLLPNYVPLTVRVLDPGNNIVKQYANVSDPIVVGYFAGDFLLSAEPLLGAWKIEIRASNSDKIIGSKQFSVDEYVLPRFDVKIVSTPSHATPFDSDLIFFVEANYTFGEPVKGKLEVTVIGPPKWNDEVLRIGFSSNPQPFPMNKTVSITDFNGRASVTIPVGAVLDPARKYDTNGRDKLEIRANFTETLTGQQRNATAFVTISNKQYKLELLSNSATFLPGFPYKLRATVSDLNGRPLPPSTKQVKIEVSFYDKRAGWGKRISSDKDLNKTVTISNNSDEDYQPEPVGDVGFGRSSRFRPPWPRPPRPTPKPIPAESVSVAVPANGLVNVDIPTPKEARRIEFKIVYQEDEKSLTVKGKESPSSSFLEIKQLSNELQAGKTANFAVDMTTRTNETIQILVQSNSNSSFLWSNSTAEPGSYVTISVPLLESMGSNGRLMVYYIRADREIVGNIFVLTPMVAMKNNVTVSAEPKSGLGYAQPGEEASFKANTSPSSFVAFLAMDESLLLMKSGNDLSRDEVDVAVSKDKFTLSEMFSVEDYFEKAYSTGQFLLTNGKLPSSREEGGYVYRPIPRPFLGGGLRGGSSRGRAKGVMFSNGGFDASENLLSLSGVAFASSNVVQKAVSRPDMTVSAPIPVTIDIKGPLGDNNLQSPRQTRKDFRQSFLFETALSNADGFAELHSKVPDAITTWRVSAFSISNTSGLGLTAVPAKLRVFQPFFVVLNLPFSIVRFENLTAEVLVFNYMSQQQDVTVQLEIRNPDNSTALQKKNVIAKPSEGAAVAFVIIPQQIGDLTLKVTAQSAFAADQLEKSLPVKPEGVKQYFTKPVFVDLRQSSSFDMPVTLPSDPVGKVTGSDRVEVRVVGDILGAAMNNLDKLIRLPTGCGEQNMATTTPNLVVAKYLKQINRLADHQKSKLVANIQLGYQRELSYRHDDNSYSAWGKSDPKGSTWLTAYVARVFAEATEFVPVIEDDVVKTALRFLIDQQKGDGSFEENGKVIDKQHQGGASSGVALTAYCLLSFLQYKDSGKAAVPKFDESMQQAISFLESKFGSLSNDSYSLAITAYALARAKSTKSPAAMDLLEQKMFRNSSVAYWTTVASLSDQGADADHSYPTNAKDVEATAYALLAYMASDKVSSALPIVSWLISKQNAEGGFVSTQDTVVGLMGLAEFAKVFGNPPSVQLDVVYGQAKQSLSITPETAIVLQSVELPSKPKALSLNARGKGVALAYVSWTYHVAKPAEDVAFDLNVTTTSSKSDLRMGICSRYLRDGSSSMAVIEVNTLSGYQFDEDEIRKLSKTVSGLRKSEMENKETKLNLYFDQLEHSPTCFKLTMYRIYKVKDLKDQSIVVYDYYNPKERRTVPYNLS